MFVSLGFHGSIQKTKNIQYCSLNCNPNLGLETKSLHMSTNRKYMRHLLDPYLKHTLLQFKLLIFDFNFKATNIEIG